MKRRVLEEFSSAGDLHSQKNVIIEHNLYATLVYKLSRVAAYHGGKKIIGAFHYCRTGHSICVLSPLPRSPLWCLSADVLE